MKGRTETLPECDRDDVVGDNRMNGLEPCIRRENVFEISMLSGKCFSLTSLNKLQAVFFFFYEGEVVILEMLICYQILKFIVFVCLFKLPSQLICPEHLLCAEDWREPFIPT